MQTRLESFIEAIISTTIGFVIAFFSSAVILPLVGLPLSLSQNLKISFFMTIISVARSYVIRRFCQAHLRRFNTWIVNFIRG
jgi:hypothetical protein